MLIFNVVVEQLSAGETAGAQDRCEAAKAWLSRNYPVREVNVFRCYAPDEANGDSKLEIQLVLEDCIQGQQFDSLLHDLSDVVGIDCGAPRNYASFPREPRVSSSMIVI